MKTATVLVAVKVRVSEAITTLVRPPQQIQFDFRNISREKNSDSVQHLNGISKTFSKKRKKIYRYFCWQSGAGALNVIYTRNSICSNLDIFVSYRFSNMPQVEQRTEQLLEL